jgi:hypothetical protein
MSTDTQKTIIGALLVGTSLLSGNAILITTAGGVGVNWTSEGLSGLWRQTRIAFSPGTPLTRAATRAIQKATDSLKDAYQKTHSPRVDLKAFELVRECAKAVVETTSLSTGSTTPVSAEAALSHALSSLLFGHDAQAVAFIQRELLGAVARAFREELSANTEAWQLFHGFLIEQLAHQASQQGGQLERLPEVLARLATQQNALETLQKSAERLEALIVHLHQTSATPGGGRTVDFQNDSLDVEGRLSQAAGDIVEGHIEVPTANRSSGTSVTFKNTRVKAGEVDQAGGSIYKDSTHPSTPKTETVSHAPLAPDKQEEK